MTNIPFVIQVDNGKVDGRRLCITGSSAGGYTTLAALAFRKTFSAGASLYGVSKSYISSQNPVSFIFMWNQPESCFSVLDS